MQNPFGTCWAFAAIAAAETSFLYVNGLGVPAGEKNEKVNFSEKQLAWFLYDTLPDVFDNGSEFSQYGEGYYLSDYSKNNPNQRLDHGGYMTYSANYFASGMGPVDEALYINDWYPFIYRSVEGTPANSKDETEEQAAKRKEFY